MTAEADTELDLPDDADATAVAQAIVDIVGRPLGRRPFRVHVDPSNDGCEVVNAVADRVRAEFLRRIGLADLLAPQPHSSTSRKNRHDR